jgi:hypothetical protein
MATVPISEEAILSVFKTKDVRSNEMLIAGQVKQQFLTNGGEAADYAEGLRYAIARGWLEPLTNNRFRLTETGFAKS